MSALQLRAPFAPLDGAVMPVVGCTRHPAFARYAHADGDRAVAFAQVVAELKSIVLGFPAEVLDTQGLGRTPPPTDAAAGAPTVPCPPTELERTTAALPADPGQDRLGRGSFWEATSFLWAVPRGQPRHQPAALCGRR